VQVQHIYSWLQKDRIKDYSFGWNNILEDVGISGITYFDEGVLEVKCVGISYILVRVERKVCPTTFFIYTRVLLEVGVICE